MLLTLAGPNLYSKQRELKKLFAGSSYESLYGEDGLGQWYELIGQSDLFGETKAVVGYGLIENLSAADQGVLAEYLEQQQIVTSAQQVVVLVENEKRLSAAPLGKLLNKGKVLHFPQPNLAKVGLWLSLEAEQLKVAIERPVAAAMVAKFNGDQFALRTELERWALLQPAVISMDDVHSMTPLTSDVNNFDLTNSLSQKNLAKSLDQLAELRRQGIPDQTIVGSLAWKIESMLLDIFQTNNYKKFLWTRTELEHAMKSLFKLDFDVKRGLAEYGVGLEMWLVESVSGADGSQKSGD